MPAYKGKASARRLLLLAVIMVGWAFLTFGPALFSRVGTGIGSTSANLTVVFIPIWLSLTIGTVVISMWFAKRLMEAERDRDAETMPRGSPAQPH